MNSYSTFQDQPIDRVLRRVERQIGAGLLAHLYFRFRDEGGNNRALAKLYGITPFDMIVLRSHPYRMFDFLTSSLLVNKGKNRTTVLQLRQSA